MWEGRLSAACEGGGESGFLGSIAKLPVCVISPTEDLSALGDGAGVERAKAEVCDVLDLGDRDGKGAIVGGAIAEDAAVISAPTAQGSILEVCAALGVACMDALGLCEVVDCDRTVAVVSGAVTKFSFGIFAPASGGSILQGCAGVHVSDGDLAGILERTHLNRDEATEGIEVGICAIAELSAPIVTPAEDLSISSDSAGIAVARFDLDQIAQPKHGEGGGT